MNFLAFAFPILSSVLLLRGVNAWLCGGAYLLSGVSPPQTTSKNTLPYLIVL